MRHELVRVHLSSAVVYILESVLLYATLIGSGTSSALELHKAEPSRARESAICKLLLLTRSIFYTLSILFIFSYIIEATAPVSRVTWYSIKA